MLTSKFKNKSKGLTLIEILVSTAVMGVILVVILELTTNILGSWNSSSGKIRSNFEARVALDTIARDLESAVFHNDGQSWLIATNDPPLNGLSSNWLRFITSAVDRNRGTVAEPIEGDLNVVSYWMSYSNPFDSTAADGQVYGLYRLLGDGGVTYTNFLGSVDNGLNVTKSVFLSNTGFTDQASGFLATNIVEFKITFFINNTQIPAGTVSFPYTDNVTGEIFSQPDFADIKLTVITDEGAKILEAVRSDEVLMAVADVILQHGKVYTRRVTFQNNAL